jgi:exodeoxyribonuclease-3
MKEKRLLSWNVNGLRSVINKGFLDWLQKEKPDVLCIQETKINDIEKLDADVREPAGYHVYWNYPERKGYAGVATFTKDEPADVRYDFGKSGLELEGRAIIAEYPGFILFNVYFPNGKASLERLKYKMAFYDVFLKYADSLKASGKKLVICGDVNTAHKEIDLARPKENAKVSGFLPEERAWMDKLVAHGYADTFRHYHKEPNQYSYWDIKTGARARNVGWRIDYFFVSENLLPAVTKTFIMPEVTGSDHCPVGIVLKTD